MEGENSSDEEEYIETTQNTLDLNYFYQNYETMKKSYKTSPKLSKYEITKVLSERAQQIANGSISFLKNAETFSNVHEIALEELKQKKIPYIIERPIPNGVEYWKLEDCHI